MIHLLGIVPNESDPFKAALITVVSALASAVVYLFYKINKLQDDRIQDKNDQINKQISVISKNNEVLENIETIYHEIKEWLIKKRD